MIEQVIISTSADTSQAENQYVGLRKEIMNLKKQLDVLEEGTVEYNKVFTQLSIKMQDQKERMVALRNSGADLGVMLGNVSKISGAISQGFAGATAALSLFGIENENLLRTIQKVQAFESIARTLESFEDAPKRIKALFQNIKGFISRSDVKINVDADVNIPKVGIDVEGSKEMAENTKIMAGAATTTAGANAQSAAAQSTTTGEITKQLPLQQQQANIEKIKLAYLESANIKRQAGLRVEELMIELDQLDLSLIEQQNAARDLGTTVDMDSYNSKKKAIQDEINLQESVKDNENEKINKLKDQVDIQNKQTEAVEKTSKVSQGLKSIWSNISTIAKGALIGGAIAAAIYGVTKLIEYFKSLSDKIRQTFSEAQEFNKEYSEAVSKATEKELGMLKILNAGYKNLGNDKKKQTEYLNTNKEKYKEVGIEINKIIKGEVSYNEAILIANGNLTERANLLATTSLLVQKYSKQLELEMQRDMNAETIRKFVPINFAFVRSAIPNINEQISLLISQGYGSTESIMNKIKADNLEAYNQLTKDQLSQLSSGIYDMLSKIPDGFQEKIKESSTELRKTNREITELEKKVTGYYENDKKGGTTQTSNLKTYTELMGELIEKQQSVKLNNPFTPEEVRKNELFFEEQKKAIDNLILELLKTPGYNSTIIENLRNYRIKLLEIERDYNLRARDLKIKDAEWNRDNNIREREDQLKKDKEYYKNKLEEAKKSLKEGVITKPEFDKLSEEYRKGSDITIIEFTRNLQEQLKIGKITYDEFKKQLNTFAGTDLTVTSPTGEIDTGNLTVENYNFIQDLLSQWDDYFKNLQEYNLNYKNQSKKTDEDIFNEKMTAIDRLTTESTRQTEMSNSRIITEMNNRNSKSWLTGFQGYRSGYKDFLDEIKQLENDLDLNKGLQDRTTERIDIIKKELENENITNEKRIELKEQLATEEQNLTNLIQDESEKRIEIAEKEQAIIDETIAGTLQGIQDIGTIINGVYDIREQTELKRLNDLYKAKLITEEEYNKQSEEVGLKYSKKRQELEIFTGTMAAVGSSIGAFQSAVNSGIPYPYNLILAGISSAAAFASVLASVAQLKSMSIDNTSNVNPVTSQTGSSLNYSLNEQTFTQERLMNKLKDQKVYILATEMTDTQDLLAKIEDMNTF